MDSEDKIHQFIIRLFTDTISNEERRELDSWISENPENKKLFNDLKEIWLASGSAQNADQYHLDEAIHQFGRKIHAEKRRRWKNVFYAPIVRYAAVIVFLIALPFSFFLGSRSNSLINSQTVVSCANGDRTNITLPDGSEVWLNSGSELIFDNNFKKGVRQTYLKGEAYFSVKKDPKNPFVVNASGVNIEVLGTEFNLKAYPDEKDVSTTLVTGSLKISGKNKQTIIKPSQKLIFNKETGSMGLVNLTDVSPDVDWKNGRLVFMNESLESMKPKLERWFDVEIEFADEQVKHRCFSGTLEKESILEAIDYFGYSPFVAYQINGNVIRFYSE